MIVQFGRPEEDRSSQSGFRGCGWILVIGTLVQVIWVWEYVPDEVVE